MSAGAGRVGRRLSRILLLLPYAIQNPGTTVGELSRRFDIPKNDLMNDLNLVFLCGLPGYGPGDLIDVDLQGDRIYIRMADYFAAPLRLTPAEGLALYAGGEAIAALPGMEQAVSLRGALSKLARALGVEGSDDGAGAIEVRFEKSPSDHVEVIQQALTDRKQVAIEYLSASREELTRRNVDPWGLIAATGRWYLVGLDHLSGEERMFRIDRIKTAAETDIEAPVPSGFDAEKYKGAFVGRDDQPVLKIEISPEAARWFEDYYPVRSAEDTSDGWRRIELFSSGDRWAAGLVVKLGRHVRSIEPDSVTQAARELAHGIRDRHRPAS